MSSDTSKHACSGVGSVPAGFAGAAAALSGAAAASAAALPGGGCFCTTAAVWRASRPSLLRGAKAGFWVSGSDLGTLSQTEARLNEGIARHTMTCMDSW